MSAEDDLLLQRLGSIVREVDPVPVPTGELGRAAFGLRRLDDELAELVEELTAADGGVRGAGGPVRLLVFRAGELLLEAQVSGAGDSLVLLGQAVLDAGTGGTGADLGDLGDLGTVRLETARLEGRSSPLDAFGVFRFDEVPPGLVRLSVQHAGRPRLTTTWFSV